MKTFLLQFLTTNSFLICAQVPGSSVKTFCGASPSFGDDCGAVAERVDAQTSKCFGDFVPSICTGSLTTIALSVPNFSLGFRKYKNCKEVQIETYPLHSCRAHLPRLKTSQSSDSPNRNDARASPNFRPLTYLAQTPPATCRHLYSQNAFGRHSSKTS
jgi:hypothetical protein